MLQQHNRVKVYGADWCGHTIMTRQHLDELGVPYEYIDVDDDPRASQWVKDHNHGLEIKPTIDIEGKVMTNPSIRELDEALQQAGLLGDSQGEAGVGRVVYGGDADRSQVPPVSHTFRSEMDGF